MTTATWYGFECNNPVCPDKERGDRSGTIIDLRLPLDLEGVPEVRCPSCGQPMHLGASWMPDESGHGSRGDRSVAHGQYAVEVGLSILRERGMSCAELREWTNHVTGLLEGKE